MRYIGDVHGKYRRYKRIIRSAPASIQVGDLGVGFYKLQGPRVGEITGNPPHYLMVRHNAEFIRGNHDNPHVCKNHSQCIPDGHYRPETKTMFIGGMFSIDRAQRKKDWTWWEDEELSYKELKDMIERYQNLRPEVMVTHGCPASVAREVLRPRMTSMYSTYDASRTEMALEQMWQAHSPKLWIFGHHHTPFDHVLNGTRFICLAELEYIDI